MFDITQMRIAKAAKDALGIKDEKAYHKIPEILQYVQSFDLSLSTSDDQKNRETESMAKLLDAIV